MSPPPRKGGSRRSRREQWNAVYRRAGRAASADQAGEGAGEDVYRRPHEHEDAPRQRLVISLDYSSHSDLLRVEWFIGKPGEEPEPLVGDPVRVQGSGDQALAQLRDVVVTYLLVQQHSGE